MNTNHLPQLVSQSRRSTAHNMFRISCLLTALVLGSTGGCADGDETKFQTITLTTGKELQVAIVLPDAFDQSKTYPVLLALPPGAQNRQMVTAGLDLYWRNPEQAKEWIVISPASPTGKYFNSGAEELIPLLLDEVLKSYRAEGGKVHLAGVSNGGTSAFRVAGLYPERFHSLMVLPGYPRNKDDLKRLEKLAHLPIAMYVGGKDSAGWLKSTKATAKELEKLKADVIFEVIDGADHVIRSWQDGKKLFKVLNQWRQTDSKQ